MFLVGTQLLIGSPFFPISRISQLLLSNSQFKKKEPFSNIVWQSSGNVESQCVEKPSHKTLQSFPLFSCRSINFFLFQLLKDHKLELLIEKSSLISDAIKTIGDPY